jgi:hypothetical protein
VSIFRRSIYNLIQREAPGGPGGGQPSDPPADVETLRAQLAHSNSELAAARKEAAGYRVGTRTRITQELSEMLGETVAQDAEPPSFDDLKPKLLTRLTAAKKHEDENRSLKLRAGLAEKFHDMGLKPGITRAALLDGGHMSRLESAVDASDFDEQIETTLGELVESMPELKGSGGPMPTRSSAQMRPPQNDSQILSREELAGMDPEEVAAALRSGKLDSILGRS